MLSISIAIGTVLRFTNLTQKTIWSDEFSTIVFSLGNSFKTVPLNQILTPDTLLQPLVPNPDSTVKNTIYNLFTESTHPPLYFMLNHWWFKLFPSESGLVSLWGARSLSVLFGILAIPAIFGLGWLTFRSLIVAQISAALMAVSPFGVALSQDARHYTLAILWVIASVSCFIVAIRYLVSDRKLPLNLLFNWIVANCLGVATHYFVIITLAAEFVVFVGLKFRKDRHKTQVKLNNWLKLYTVGFMSLFGCSIWLVVWHNFHDKHLIQWIYGDNNNFIKLIEPIGQLPVAWATMLFLLPIESQNIATIVISAILMLGLLILTVYSVWKAWAVAKSKNQAVPEFQWLGALIFTIMAIFFVLAYAKFSDILSAIRYNFVYFPPLIVLISGSLSLYFQLPQLSEVKIFKKLKISTNSLVLFLWIMGLIGSLVVISGVGFQKPYRPDLVANKITELSQPTALITIFHDTHIQTSKMMGIAWEINQRKLPKDAQNYQFLLNHPECNLEIETNCISVEKLLYKTVNQIPKPLDVWVVDYPSLDINVGDNCVLEPTVRFKFPGFKAKRYHCSNPS
ncbi:glycosyltransferase family 39 protein [Merismopedia glauca]|uniref:glycosyltransferase family 39 protein n=1 Tax=Merismopedia glauca TaxID=292586 RepID=UPI0011B20463|nr:glycosyltransferase [Merismopedia glauca]